MTVGVSFSDFYWWLEPNVVDLKALHPPLESRMNLGWYGSVSSLYHQSSSIIVYQFSDFEFLIHCILLSHDLIHGGHLWNLRPYGICILMHDYRHQWLQHPCLGILHGEIRWSKTLRLRSMQGWGEVSIWMIVWRCGFYIWLCDGVKSCLMLDRRGCERVN